MEGFKNNKEAMLWVLTLTKGAAADWAQLVMGRIHENQRGAPRNCDELFADFLTAFGDPDTVRAVERQITTLIQTGTSTDYATEFQNLLAELEWNKKALMAQYRRGIHFKVKDQLSFLENPPTTLRTLITKSIELANRRRENEADRPPKTNKSNKPSLSAGSNKNNSPSNTTMQTPLKESGNYVDDAKKECRRKAGVCVKCGRAGHTFKECQTGWKAPKKEDKKEEKKDKGKNESGATATIETVESEESEWENE